MMATSTIILLVVAAVFLVLYLIGAGPAEP